MQEEIKTLCDDLVEEMIMIICYNTYHYDENSKDVNLNDWDKIINMFVKRFCKLHLIH